MSRRVQSSLQVLSRLRSPSQSSSSESSAEQSSQDQSSTEESSPEQSSSENPSTQPSEESTPEPTTAPDPTGANGEQLIGKEITKIEQAASGDGSKQSPYLFLCGADAKA